MKDDFTMGKLLGQGAFGKVYHATHKKIGHQVAIKTYEKSDLKDKTICMAIHREIHILSALEHSSIMRLYDVIDSKTKC